MKTLTNPEIFSLRGKKNGQSRKKQEWAEYTLTTSYGPSQRVRRERERTKQKALHPGIEDFICSSSFVVLGNRLKQRKLQAGQEQEWPVTRYTAHVATCMTWNEKNATAVRALNGIEDNFFIILIL